MKLDRKKIESAVSFVRVVAESGGPGKIIEAVDDRAYRRGVKDGRRLEKTGKLTAILIAASAAALVSQIPHLLVFLKKQGEKKAALKREEEEKIEAIRREFADRLSPGGEWAKRFPPTEEV